MFVLSEKSTTMASLFGAFCLSGRRMNCMDMNSIKVLHAEKLY